MKKPSLIITMGDPSGVGPEIIVKSIRRWDIEAIPIVVGDRKILRKAEEILGVKILWSDFTSPAGDGPFLYDLNNVDLASFSWGEISPSGGKASYEYIEKAVELMGEGRGEGVVTAPINKEAIHKAGIPFIGHTEIFQELTHSEEALTMFQVKSLRVFFFTRHLPLKVAIEQVKKDKIAQFIPRMHYYLQKLGLSHPRIAVAALNPHGGERGLLGEEETKEIIPALELVRSGGIEISGPYPADSIFWRAFQGEFDAVLSLYHDQGHIATKCLDFYKTVSVTLGLPFIRTSPDHGTAMDIAGKGIANEESMLEACRHAAQYAVYY